VIIPGFNGEGFIGNAINSVLKGSVDADILVVDNASSDLTISVAKNLGSRVQIIESKYNEGFGRAINRGFEYGQTKGYDLFLIMNQDVVLFENTLERMLDFVSNLNSEAWFFVSPFNLSADGKTEEHYFAENLKLRSDASESKELGNHVYREVNFINAACWLVNPKALKVLKGFDKRFFMYGEDLDICNRALKLGFKMYVLENSTCVHHKEFGDYENHPRKMLALKLGESMAWYLNPSINLSKKIRRFLAINMACLKLAIKGRTQEAGEKFRINLTAVLRLL